MKNDMFLHMKEYLITFLEEKSVDDAKEIADQLKHYSDIFSTFHLLHDVNPQIEEEYEEDEEEKEKEEKEEVDFNESGKGEFNQLEEEKENNIYRFERNNMKGGTAVGIDAYVPERIVRELQLEHGDKIKAHKLGEALPGEMQKYRYELYDRSDEPEDENQNRVQLNHCPVENQGGILMVTTSYEAESAKKFRGEDGAPLLFRIQEKDIQELQIKEGDRVDLCYLRDNPGYFRVIWKHSEAESSSYQAPRPAGYYKEKPKSEKSDLPQDFKGKTILVVGMEPKKANYRQVIETRGGTFRQMSGNERKDRLRAAIRKADMVILITEYMRHRGSIDSVALCKEYGIPFDKADSLGNSEVVSIINEALAVTS